MKNDINLLYKRDTKTYSIKKILTFVLVIIIIAGALYAGITIPSSHLASLKEKANELENKLGSSTSVQTELAGKSQQYKTLQVMLQEITALGDQKSDVINYLDAVEKSLPTDANLSHLRFYEQTLEINGSAKNDSVLATFCLKLREQKNSEGKSIFSDVYVLSSIVSNDSLSTDFSLNATLPQTLESGKIIGAIEAKANPSSSPSASPSASPEVSK